MISQLIEIVRMYQTDVESRIQELLATEASGKDVQDQISHWDQKLRQINKALQVPAALENDTRLIAATFLIALDRETNPEPMDELGDILDELVRIDVDVEGTGRTCQAAEIRDAVDVTELAVRDFSVDVEAS